ncbi:response regulator [Emticicia sp. C21]|uniref:response regulator n=1 Tax=Emticicia sp. C21 TaxID=2302915 RepID=UPI000E3503BE|nr:response regulator [Emticicia sp. C21]RFS13328.1 response regulator [Emticicia sp. C21]
MKRNFTILLAEDDEDDQVIFQYLIDENPALINLICVKNGEELIELLNSSASRDFDIIIIDIDLPYNSGLEYLKEIRRNRKFDPIKCVIFSIIRDSKTIEEAYQAGADLCLSKPYDYNNLKELLNKILAL